MSLFVPTYFSPIAQYSEIIKSEKLTFEVEDNFQKQSFRNRCYIYNGNGKQLLSIPVKKATQPGRKKTKDTLVENNFPWQDQHFKSLQTAYRVSPYFEFFEDDLEPIFTKKYKYLLDINIDTFLFIADALQLDSLFTKTEEYMVQSEEDDFRQLAEIKNQPKKTFKNYVQMFDDKHGFIPNLSILDVLFMEGPNAISFF
ncbi:WbqC family protein [Polaribacter sp.]|nr:WbqC family protein [Polaribacter sp.]